jgi:hypothetical protein
MKSFWYGFFTKSRVEQIKKISINKISGLINMTQTLVTLLWTSSIVIAELFAFYLIQKNVDEEASWININMIASIFLFGIVVTYSFRQVLLTGTNIPLANLYWIMFSQIGAVIMAYILFSHKIQVKDWIAIALLFVYVVITFFSPNHA